MYLVAERGAHWHIGQGGVVEETEAGKVHEALERPKQSRRCEELEDGEQRCQNMPARY